MGPQKGQPQLTRVQYFCRVGRELDGQTVNPVVLAPSFVLAKYS